MGASLYAVGSPALPLQELVDLTAQLMLEPNSWLHAAAAGWEYPVSRDWIATTDLYDLQHASKSRKKTRPYPRPWPDEKKNLIGGTKKVRRTAAEVMAILRPQQ